MKKEDLARAIGFSLLILMACACFPKFVFAETYDEYLSKGLEEQGKGNYAEAIDIYNKVIELDPINADAYNHRARAYYLNKEYVKAQEDMRKVKEMGGEPDPDFIDDLDRAAGTQTFPLTAQDYYSKGLEYDFKNDFTQAIDYYTKAIEADPNYAEAYSKRAEAYFFRQDYDKAYFDIIEAESRGYIVDPIMKRHVLDFLGEGPRRR